jgi:hypothetical protein
MFNENEMVALAVGALGILGIFLLFKRIRSAAVRRSALVNTGLRAGNPWSPSRPPRKGSTIRLKGIFARKNSAIEQTFRAVFFTAADRGEGLIEYYMNRYECGRTEAMKRAIEERERDERRYD